MSVRKIIIIAGLIVTVMIVGYQLRHSSPSKESTPTHSLKLSPSYSLAIMQESERKFEAQARIYHYQDENGEVVLTHTTSSGGLFPRYIKGTIKFDPITLRGTWYITVDGVLDGGEIELNNSVHGFDAKFTYTIGDHAGEPPFYGKLIAQE